MIDVNFTITELRTTLNVINTLSNRFEENLYLSDSTTHVLLLEKFKACNEISSFIKKLLKERGEEKVDVVRELDRIQRLTNKLINDISEERTV